MMIAGCKKVKVDFTYSPTNPKAGEIVKFTNNSSAGEEWLWTFGDNATSFAKHPSKIYKKPGEYKVTLMVDSAKHQTRSAIITVHDTMPTFVCLSNSIRHYYDVTFMANIYNPFNYPLEYKWILPENCKIVSGSATTKVVTVYFTSAGEANVQLSITQKDKVHEIKQTFTVQESKAPAILMRKTDKTVSRQRIINDRLENVIKATSEDVYCIEQATDTMVTFNGKTFYASKMANEIDGFLGMNINRIQIDSIAQKWYFITTTGLSVANLDGSNITLIDKDATGAIYVDVYYDKDQKHSRNRIYWATDKGLYAMPLVKSKNNQFTSTFQQYNDIPNIDLITVNNKPQ